MKKQEDYFKNYKKYGKKIKNIVKRYVPDASVFIFGSIWSKKYAIGLSDVDVAIISDEFNSREIKLKLLDKLLDRYFFSQFEFHLLTKKQ